MASIPDKNLPPYQGLTPECVLDAVDSAGFRSDGRLLALNSYENRVYQVGQEEGAPLIAKFYRPGRWDDAAILEEHAFALALAAAEIPVVAPLVDDRGTSLHRHAGFRFALYPRRGGHAPELDDPDTLLRLGRFIGRIHALGAVSPFRHRPTLDVGSFGEEPARLLLERDFIPAAQRTEYVALTDRLLEACREVFAGVAPKLIRLHGDCHPGNLLWTESGGHIVDLDDARMGPAVQDLWMLLSGERPQMAGQMIELLEGYEEFHDFDRRELRLIEALRTLRLIHYAGWLAQRWDDPAFPRSFPWFNTPAYWEEHLVTLREQRWRMEEPPLRLQP